jgi:hypothetical protein
LGNFPGNAWGLHDMHGNVFEWCADWYAAYPERDARHPFVKEGGRVRVVRGGSWHSLVRRCRSAARGWGAPGYRGSDVGCRVCFRLESDYGKALSNPLCTACRPCNPWTYGESQRVGQTFTDYVL